MYFACILYAFYYKKFLKMLHVCKIVNISSLYVYKVYKIDFYSIYI